jgi:hypothetical protein
MSVIDRASMLCATHMRSSLARVLPLVCACLVAPCLRASAATCSAAGPFAVYVAPELRRLVDELLENSPTFKAQWDRLGREPKLYVRVRLDSRLDDSAVRGRTVVLRADDRTIVALVDIRVFGDRTELLGHEIEHVIEQIEGLDLRRLAATGRHRVWESHHGMFETERAIRAGQRVFREMRERPSPEPPPGTPPPDRAVLLSRR